MLHLVPSKQTSTSTSPLVVFPVHGHEPGEKAVGSGGGATGGGADGGELVQHPSHTLASEQPSVRVICAASAHDSSSRAEHGNVLPSGRSHACKHAAGGGWSGGAEGGGAEGDGGGGVQ